MSWSDQKFLGPAQETLYGLAGQDMPVGYDEVEEAINDYTQELLDAVLFGEMIERHRPVVRRDLWSYNPSMRNVQCAACDANVWQTVLLGRDEIPECKFWANAKKLGLVTDAETPDDEPIDLGA